MRISFNLLVSASSPDAFNLARPIGFIMDEITRSREIKCLTCVVDFTKECLPVTDVFRISCVQVTHVLGSISLFRGYLSTIKLQH